MSGPPPGSRLVAARVGRSGRHRSRQRQRDRNRASRPRRRPLPWRSPQLSIAASKICSNFPLSNKSDPIGPGRCRSDERRYWQADVGARTLLYPYEATQLGTIEHDGIVATANCNAAHRTPPPTLVMASCDPAVGLLAGELARTAGIRLLAFFRPSRQALALLKQGLVHVAGSHLSHAATTATPPSCSANLAPATNSSASPSGKKASPPPRERPLLAPHAGEIETTLGRPRTGLRRPPMSRRTAWLASRAATHRPRPPRRRRSDSQRLGRRRRLPAARRRGGESQLSLRPQGSVRPVLRRRDGKTTHESVALVRSLLGPYRQLIDDLPGYRSSALALP